MSNYYDDDDNWDDGPADECDHDDYELDILTGRATCCCCDHVWYPSDEAIEAEIQRQADYLAEMEAEEAKR